MALAVSRSICMGATGAHPRSLERSALRGCSMLAKDHKVACYAVGFDPVMASTINSVSAGVPSQGRSAIVRQYRMCTRDERRPQLGQREES